MNTCMERDYQTIGFLEKTMGSGAANLLRPPRPARTGLLRHGWTAIEGVQARASNGRIRDLVPGNLSRWHAQRVRRAKRKGLGSELIADVSLALKRHPSHRIACQVHVRVQDRRDLASVEAGLLDGIAEEHRIEHQMAEEGQELVDQADSLADRVAGGRIAPVVVQALGWFVWRLMGGHGEGHRLHDPPCLRWLARPVELIGQPDDLERRGLREGDIERQMLPDVRDGKKLTAVKLPGGIAESSCPQSVHLLRPVELVTESTGTFTSGSILTTA